MELLIVILLVVFGVGFLIAELFLLPGFGIAGLFGFGMLIASVVVAYKYLGSLAGHITLGAVLLLSIVATYVFFKSRVVEKMGLDAQIDSKVGLAEPGKKIEDLKKTENDKQEKGNEKQEA